MNLSIDEKIKLFCGKDGWSTYSPNKEIKSVSMSDGPAGIRKVVTDEDGKSVVLPTTIYPSESVIANSWNTELCKKIASSLADEAIEKNIDVLLAPAVNIKRSPLCGRNFEYFSEDPYLSGKMAEAYVNGLEKNGVCSCVKHFAANNMETERSSLTVDVDERTLMEIYLKSFEMALKSHPSTIMSSYNRLNGIYASQNKYLLTEILRERWNFDGVVISDWWAIKNGTEAIKNGCNLHMPFKEGVCENIKKSYQDGLITEDEIDRAIKPVVDLSNKCKNNQKTRKGVLSEKDRHDIATNGAEEGIVLLKNDGLLPLNKEKILVLGSFNNNNIVGGGSGSAELKKPLTPLQNYLQKDLKNSKVTFLNLYYCLYGEVVIDGLLKSEVEAEENDCTILCIGNNRYNERESFDRKNLKLSKDIENIINIIGDCCKNLVVVLTGGSAIDVSSWQEKANAILYAGFAGEGVCEAVSGILSGRVCPSGKLNETFPMSIKDTPDYNEMAHYNGVVKYKEGTLVGYRYYEAKNIDVMYPFGYGLSYAKFIYSDLKITKINDEPQIKIQLKIKNSSKYNGKEVVQVYVKNNNSSFYCPYKELKAFKKILIKSGETESISFELKKDSFSKYSTTNRDWIVDHGTYEIMVGASSQDIRLCGKIKI